MEKLSKEELGRILKDSRLYDYFNYNYADNAFWYIEYDKKRDTYYYHFNKFKIELDKESYDIVHKLYGKRSINLKRLK